MEILPLEIPTPFTIGSINAYLIIGDDITLVDTGPKTDNAWKSLVYQLNEKKIKIQDVKRIVLTHYHIDHSGLVSLIKEHNPEIDVYAHRLAIAQLKKQTDYIEHSMLFFRDLYLKNGLSEKEIKEIEQFYQYLDPFSPPVDFVIGIEEGDKINGITDWQILHTPGHSLGDIVLYYPDKKYLISGDIIIGRTSPGIFIEAPQNAQADYEKSAYLYQQSLMKLNRLDIKKVYPAHGPMFSNVYGVIDEHLGKMEYRQERIKSLLTNQSFTVYEIMQQIFPKRYSKHLAMFFSETLGSLDIMELNGEVVKKKENGMVKYLLKQ